MTATRARQRRAVPDLLYSDVEDDVRDSVRKLVESRSDWHAVLQRTESDDTVDRDLWRALVSDLGLAALPVAEISGGAGASWRETATVLEELGRGVAAVPFLGSAVVATAYAMSAGDSELLHNLADGSTAAAVVAPFAASGFGAVGEGSGDRIRVQVSSVADALAADVLLVPLSTGEVVRVDAGASGVDVTATVSLDMTRQLADVRIDIPRGDAAVVTSGQDTVRALDRAALIGQTMLASEQLGIAEWCLETTVAYLKDRRQFGRTLGSYQALKHRCADLWVEITQARAVARYAAGCAAADAADLPIAASLAQAVCSAVAVNAAEECVQLHGGVGFTWESPVHLRLKRAKADALAFGGADHHRGRLAELVDLPVTTTSSNASATEESS